MIEIAPSTVEIVEALKMPVDLEFELPDPEDDTLAEDAFQQQVDDVWKVCDRTSSIVCKT